MSKIFQGTVIPPKKLINKPVYSHKHALIFILIFALIGGLGLWLIEAANPALPGDVNNDNKVDLTDLSILLSNYATTNSSADLDGNSKVDILDLSILLSHYGNTYIPPSSGRVAYPPIPPSAYTLPTNYIKVKNGPELLTALQANTSQNIVLADGDYSNTTYFENIYGHKMYSEHLGGAILRAGLVFGHNWGQGGGVVQGIKIDLSDANKTLQSSLIHVWGLARDTQILDVVLDGHSSVESGIDSRQVDGLILKRVIAKNFTGYGVRVDANILDLNLEKSALIEDIDASSVSRAVPMSSNGTAEACVWIGNTSTVRRIRTRDCAWMGVWSGTSSHHSLFEDLDIDRTTAGVGMYAEHFSRNNTYQRLHVGPNIIRGMICEWSDPVWNNLPACVDTVIQDSLFDTTCAGVVLDEGTTRTTVRRTTFKNQNWAAIDNYKGINNLWDISGNNYSGILPGAVNISTEHHGSPCPNPQDQL